MTLNPVTMKRFIPALALAALASLPLAARADLLKQGATYNRDILVTDTTGANVNSLASGAFTVTQSQAGGAATTITPTITFKSAGHYNVAYTAAMTATLGSSALVITATGAVQTDVGDQVVAFDPNGANLGLTNLDAAVSTRSTFAGGAVASVTGAVGSVTAPVTAGTVTDKTGYSATATNFTAAPTPAQNAAAITFPTTVAVNNFPSTVVASNLPTDYQQRAVAVTLPTTAPTGYGGTTGDTSGVTTLLSRLPAALSFTAGNINANAQVVADKTGYTAATVLDKTGYTATASNLPSDYQQRAVAVTLPTTAPTGYGAGAGGGTAQSGDLFALLNPLVSAGKFTAPALSLAPLTTLPSDYLTAGEQLALQGGAGFVTVPITGTTTGVSEVLTLKQTQALALSVASGNDIPSGPPVASSSITVTYYLVGLPSVAANVVEVATVNYDASRNQTSRTVKVAQPFPAVN